MSESIGNVPDLLTDQDTGLLVKSQAKKTSTQRSSGSASFALRKSRSAGQVTTKYLDAAARRALLFVFVLAKVVPAEPAPKKPRKEAVKDEVKKNDGEGKKSKKEAKEAKKPGKKAEKDEKKKKDGKETKAKKGKRGNSRSSSANKVCRGWKKYGHCSRGQACKWPLPEGLRGRKTGIGKGRGKSRSKSPIPPPSDLE